MPGSSWGGGGGGGGWAQLEFTDALFHRSYRYRLSKAKAGGLLNIRPVVRMREIILQRKEDCMLNYKN